MLWSYGAQNNNLIQNICSELHSFFPMYLNLDMTTSLPPGSGSLTPGVTIGLAVAGSLVGVLLLLILLFFLCHCGKKLSKCYSRNRPLRPSTLENVYTPHYSQPWVLKGLVGQGRFGHVYKALYDGNIVAVKVYSHHK